MVLGMTTTHHVSASDCLGLGEGCEDARMEGSPSLLVAFPPCEVKKHGQRRAVGGETRPSSLLLFSKHT